MSNYLATAPDCHLPMPPMPPSTTATSPHSPSLTKRMVYEAKPLAWPKVATPTSAQSSASSTGSYTYANTLPPPRCPLPPPTSLEAWWLSPPLRSLTPYNWQPSSLAHHLVFYPPTSWPTHYGPWVPWPSSAPKLNQHHSTTRTLALQCHAVLPACASQTGHVQLCGKNTSAWHVKQCPISLFTSYSIECTNLSIQSTFASKFSFYYL